MRTETDFLGERHLPDDVYYGVQTLRGIENFPITGIPISTAPSLVHAFGAVKKAAALTNHELGVLDKVVTDAIVAASESVMRGELDDQFVVDVIQGGAGTSTHMNVNEVIANKALEVMGEPKGSYDIVSPNDHVNRSQSTNDAYPTAFRIALWHEIGVLTSVMAPLRDAFAAKSAEFSSVVKMGRTHLQDAVPMTMGQEFGAFATTIDEDILRLEEARSLVTEVNIGATAIGTSITAPVGYPQVAIRHLRDVTGIPLTLSANLVEATWDTGAYVQISGVLKRVAVKLSKICNDLRMLSSGPRAGLNEINLPSLQPGSSIMPGKVNPVIPEVVNQVCFRVIGNDVTISFAAEAGQLQLNVMEPVIAYSLFESLRIMTKACTLLREKCVVGIEANTDRTRDMVLQTIGIVTALTPTLGYKTCASIAREAYERGASVIDIVLERGLLSREQLDAMFSPESILDLTKNS